MNKQEWPKYYGNQLIVGSNPEADIGIITGWTKREKVAEQVGQLSEDYKGRIAVIGQLYSKEGISYIIRNLALNLNIKNLVITGLDLSGSVANFEKFLKGDPSTLGMIHKEIPQEVVEKFIQYFSKNSHRVDLKELNDFLIGFSHPQAISWIGNPIPFDEPHKNERSDFPSESVCFRLEDKNIADLWLKVLDRIMKFGREKMSQYSEMQRELVNITTVISDEDPDNPVIPEYMYFDKKDLDNYYPQLMTDEIPDGVEYTYGSRFRNFKGHINQMESVIEELRRENYSRRAIMFTWDVEKDTGNPKSPCLDLFQILVQGDYVYATAYLRSNDMYRAWPQNAFGLRKMHKEVTEALGLKMGKLQIISNSAHIYERDYMSAMETVEKYKTKTECTPDPRGNFEVSIDKEEGLIKLNHYTPEGLSIQELSGKNIQELRDKIHFFISDVIHALYIGNEIAKAEIALKKGVDYVQDRELK